MTLALQPPFLIADIGGTNCRLGVIDQAGGEARLLGRIDTQGGAELHDAIADVVRDAEVEPQSALLAVAGPVTGARMAITNAGREFDGEALGRRLGLDAVLLVNDFEAQAAALPSLKASDLHTLQIGARAPGGARLALGPGTGFGVGLLIDAGDAFVVAPSEGSHSGFGPETEEEALIWPHLERVEGRITIESTLSGQGLARLHRARALAAGDPAPLIDPAAIAASALAGDDESALATVKLFLRLLARAAADLALVAKATGGVFIAGGVAPRLLPLWDAIAFADAFAARDPMRDMLRRMPVHIVTTPYPAFVGLGALADPAARVRVARPVIWRA